MIGAKLRNPEQELEQNKMNRHDLNGDAEAFEAFRRERDLVAFREQQAQDAARARVNAIMRAEAEAPHVFRRFCEAHGNNPRKDGNRYLLPDGAAAVESPYGHTFYEPSPYALEKLATRKRYHVLYLTRAEEDFNRLKMALEGQGASVFHWPEDHPLYGRPGADGIESLQKIQRFVLREREHIAAIEAEIAKCPEMVAQRQREETKRKMDFAAATARFNDLEKVRALQI